jgi:hypothetical protein
MDNLPSEYDRQDRAGQLDEPVRQAPFVEPDIRALGPSENLFIANVQVRFVWVRDDNGDLPQFMRLQCVLFL